MDPIACMTTAAASAVAAPRAWASVDVLSDVHLQASEPETALRWAQHLATTSADAVFILGDLFEVWVGDDCLNAGSGFEWDCCQQINHLAARKPVFVMHGNRDFLLGEGFARCSGAQLITDPFVLNWDGVVHVLMSHGDAWCTDDAEYMQFRQQVRTPHWQQAFLQQPLAQRQHVAGDIRAQSEARKRMQTSFHDINLQLAAECTAQFGAALLIHGHTHRPSHDALPTVASPHTQAVGALATSVAVHAERYVLSDWDASASPPRLEIIRLHRPPRANSGSALPPIASLVERIRL